MKSNETKLKFIELRAAGMSYEKIGKELHISKATCTKLENELAGQISSLKAAQLSELYESYYMTREARIKKLGGTLSRIDEALEAADLSEMPPDKLLDYKLKYEAALKDEYIPLPDAEPLKKNFSEKDVLNSMADLLNRVQNGTTSREQAQSELSVFQNILRAFENVELRKKIEALEVILDGRS